MPRPSVCLVTGNEHKVREAAMTLGRYGIHVARCPMRKLEVQSDDLAHIARTAAESLCGQESDGPLLVEDAGLFVRSLRGFPGPYSDFAYRTIGIEGILRLLDGVEDRSAYFMAALCACWRGKLACFSGVVEGTIAQEPRGTGGFGFDPIFIPSGYAATFAELGEDVKSHISHRARALAAFAEWFLSKEL